MTIRRARFGAPGCSNRWRARPSRRANSRDRGGAHSEQARHRRVRFPRRHRHRACRCGRQHRQPRGTRVDLGHRTRHVARIVEERRKRPFADAQDLMRAGQGHRRGTPVQDGGRRAECRRQRRDRHHGRPGRTNRAPRHRQAWPGDAAHREGHATVTRPESRPRLYWRLVRMHRPIGILLLLWPTLGRAVDRCGRRPPRLAWRSSRSARC